MQISFQTKEESTDSKEKLSKVISRAERVFMFIELSKQINVFPSKHKPKPNDNFVIDFTKKNDGKIERD